MKICDILPWRLQSRLGYRPQGSYESFHKYHDVHPEKCNVTNVLPGGCTYLNPPGFSTEIIPKNFSEVIAYHFRSADIYTVRNASVYMWDYNIGVITECNRVIADNTFCCDADYKKKIHPFFTIEKIPRAVKYKGICLVLAVSAGDTFYWHWMIESLPKYGLIENLKKTYQNYDYVLVNEMLRPFHEQTLNILGIPTEKLLFLSDNTHYSFDMIDVPSQVRNNPWVIHYLRNRFLLNKQSVTPDLNIYVSRQKARWRKIDNEDELFRLLEEKYGFIKVLFEDMSVNEQIELALRTRNTVSLVGSNQVNMIFYPPGANIVEIQPSGLANVVYWVVSEQCGHHYSYFEAEISDKNLQEPLEYHNLIVDVKKMDQYLEKIIKS